MSKSCTSRRNSLLQNSTKLLGRMVFLTTTLSVILIILILTVLSFNGRQENSYQTIIVVLMCVTALFLSALIIMTLNLCIQHSQAVQSVSDSKDYFIANISHEIKTPLNAIIGMVHMLRKTELSEKQQDLITKIDLSSGMLSSIINDVLDYSKMKKNSLDFFPAEFRLYDLLRDIEDMFLPTITEKGLGWITEYNFDKSICLYQDRVRLTQVLINLMSNALKFTDKGHIKLSVSCTVYDDEDALLLFSLEDTGIGIPDNSSKNLFHEYVQLENHLTKIHQGTGLGLPLCQYIVTHMGGKIWHTSDPSHAPGTVFNFTISAPVIEQSYAQEDKIHSTLTLNGRGQKVLVVEDTEINFDVAKSLLAEVNIVCEHATDGLDAIKLCKSHCRGYYQAILMDIHMPNMDGYEAAAILRKEVGINAPILALTATNVNAEVISAYRGILEDYIFKPFKPAQLYASLSPYFVCSNTCCAKEDAVENMGGSMELYQKHLRKFLTNYAGCADEIEAVIKANDFNEAHRLVHSVKGLAMTFGITCLHETAKQLEELLLDVKDRGPEIMEALNLEDILTLLNTLRAKMALAQKL